MIRLFKILFLLITIASFGQTDSLSYARKRIKVSPTFFAVSGKTYVDSIEMNLSKTYLDPRNIKEVRYFKNEDAMLHSGSKGALLITRKKQTPFVSLSRIISNSKTAIDKSLPTEYIVDGIVVDTAAVKIEVTAIKSITTLLTSNKPELIHRTQKNVVVLVTRMNKRKKKTISK